MCAPHRLMDMCLNGPMTSGGMDGWAPRDRSLLPIKAFELLASLLNIIERGAPWPDGTTHGRAAYLAKGDIPSLDVVDYRVLQTLPILYRRWAALRLRDVAPWVEEWRIDELFAGMPGVGAEDAWWTTSLLIGHSRLHGNTITGGAVDIFMYFDQISRALLRRVLTLAGFPQRILEPYIRFHTILRTYNSVAGGLGKPFQKEDFSIPQGCPIFYDVYLFINAPMDHGAANR